MPFFSTNTISIYQQTTDTDKTYQRSDDNTDSLLYSNISADIQARRGELDSDGNQFFDIYIDIPDTSSLLEKNTNKYRLNDGTYNYSVYSIEKRPLLNYWEILALRKTA